MLASTMAPRLTTTPLHWGLPIDFVQYSIIEICLYQDTRKRGRVIQTKTYKATEGQAVIYLFLYLAIT